MHAYVKEITLVSSTVPTTEQLRAIKEGFATSFPLESIVVNDHDFRGVVKITITFKNPEWIVCTAERLSEILHML